MGEGRFYNFVYGGLSLPRRIHPAALIRRKAITIPLRQTSCRLKF